MSLNPYLVSLGVGLGVGVLYGLLAVRSPAPPIIALLGLLGMLAGEAAVQWLRGHSDVVAKTLHTKSFAVSSTKDTTLDPNT
ncbi:MAG: DUF1427 family protein [Pseudomonadota bacterium]